MSAAAGIDLEGATKAALEAAVAAGAADAEAFAIEEDSREIRVHGGEVESLTAATERGVGVRAWNDHRVGFAFGVDLSREGIADLGRRAADAAAIADPDEHAGIAEAGDAAPVTGLAAPLSDWPTARVVELALAIEGAALAADPVVSAVEQTVYADSFERLAIATSAGGSGSYELSSCYGFAYALARGDSATETGLGFGVGRGPASLDPQAIGAEAGTRAASMIGAEKPRSRSCPVVFDPTVAASFIGLIGSTLAADAVQRGRSPFAERLGEEVASPALTITDDGLHPDGIASGPFDGEGTPRQRTPLIEGGRLRTFLHDAYTARRGGTKSTGNASRNGYRSLPSASPSNLIVAPGNQRLEALLDAAGEGLLVTDVAGLHSGVNPVSGVFSVGASGRMISGGELRQPLREFTIASDLVSMLGAVGEVGADPRWVPFGGSVSTPPLLVAEMAISGS